MLALIKTPWWPQLDAGTWQEYGELVAHLSEHIGEFALPVSTATVLD